MSRGQSTAIEFALNVFGVVVAYWLKFGLSYIDGGRSALRWHFPVAFRIIPLLFLVAIVWVFFESPRWLAKFGRDSESRYILGRLRGETGADADKAEDEFRTIRGIVELEKKTIAPQQPLPHVLRHRLRLAAHGPPRPARHLAADRAGVDRHRGRDHLRADHHSASRASPRPEPSGSPASTTSSTCPARSSASSPSTASAAAGRCTGAPSARASPCSSRAAWRPRRSSSSSPSSSARPG
ncbi:hypothetical protein LTR16_005626 [Cryomyces antarcticus]|uniref:Major facilitator superfamily (MFS) profile domain-containing protein n=1 Tax=Cryomyces antarcticus TaxID=329879 RepID=A0ABR0M5E5_9PEZI|nr:hypothetical protein LTR39_005133 [Cryomyces antarcticus]KAK5282922.1 hypothetical protein LTR16_005626 [Cryomyces antarcticus]